MHTRGFTLVELMIVVVIVIILAAILIPRYIDVTVTARIARCHSAQRSLEAAAMMYMGAWTNTDHAPPASPSDLIPVFLPQLPTCPDGGTYDFTGGMQATCSVATHVRSF